MVNEHFSKWVLCITVATTIVSIDLSHCLSLDGEALLVMKRSLNDTRGFLKNWDISDSTPCNWTGISCHIHDHRVKSINLPHMQLSGSIAPVIGNLTRLHRLAFHQNNLQGAIPTEIGSCIELRALYLRSNNLDGTIPPQIGKLSSLIVLDLSRNSLRGSIPSTIGRLQKLRFLNLSSNFLSGEIPNVGALVSFTSSSFFGNSDLCGEQVQKICKGSLGFPAVFPHVDNITSTEVPDLPTKKEGYHLTGVLIGAISSMIVALAMILCFIWICLLSRKVKNCKKYITVDKQCEEDAGAKLVTFHGDLPYASYIVIKKLEALDEDNVLGSGGFGTVYRMNMNNLIAFAVKKITINHEVSDQILEQQLQVLGTIKHKNLATLYGYCRLSSFIKYLIYEFFELGSLEQVLHENGQEKTLLNWNTRIRIAVGAARGLTYLHHDCCPSIIHCNVKSSNILLDKNLEPHVSDFGFSSLLVDDDAHVTTVVAGSFGYFAPEFLNSGQATEKSDVYSYGVVLLELITGRKPSDPSFARHGLNMVGWMNTLIMGEEDWMKEIMDRNCDGIDEGTLPKVVEIAAKCTDLNPDRRPSMKRVLQMLEEEIMSPCPSDFYESHSDNR